MDKTFINKYIERSRELGASGCRVIDPRTVITAPWVRLKCRYGCGFYNTNRCCPPYTPDDGEMRRILDSYVSAFLVHFDGYDKVNRAIMILERELMADGFYKAVGFGAGPCRKCEVCSIEKCRCPSEPRPSLTGCGVDVLATAGNNGFPAKLCAEASAQADCYGLILVE